MSSRIKGIIDAVIKSGIVGAGAAQSEDADASLRSLAQRGMSLVDIIDPKDSRVGEYYLQKGSDPKSIGSVKTDYALDSGFGDGYMASQNTEIAPGYRRQGLAREMYDAIEEVSGNKLVPSDTLSPDGAAMWNARNRGLLEQVQQRMGSDNYDTVEQVLRPDGMTPSLQLKGFSRNFGTTGLGAGLLGGLQSEDAEAGPISEALNLGQRVLQLGILKAESAGNPNAVKTAITKYQNAMRNNPAFADRERRAYANDYETVFSAAPIPDRQIITPESLVGKTLTPVRGDRSDIGHLSQVGGIPIDVPVEGGNKFSRQYGGWASAEPIARGQHNKHIAAAEDTQNDVFGVYNTMGRDSVNFSTPIAEGMMQQIPELRRLAKADINDFDKEIRSLKSVKYVKGGDNVTTYPYSDWVGLDHPDAMSQLMGENGYPRWGKLRTAFTTTMGKAAYRDKGFPSYDELVKATEDPALVSASIGDSGHSIYKADTTKGAQPFDQHKTYDYQMPGEYAGGFEQSVPFNVMFPKSFDRFINTKTKSGKLMTPDQATVATNIRKDGYEVADQQWLDGVQGFIDRNKQRAAAGGLLASGGANANTVSQPQSGGLLDSIGDTALETMSGVNRAMADGVNFLTSDQINAILNLSGSDKRIPDLYDLPGVESGTKGNYMEPGLLRQIVRQGSEFLSPI